MAESSRIQLVVITPERLVLEETTDFVVFTAHDGEVGILRDRAALMCELGIGQVRYQPGTQRVFIDGGFAQVFDNAVAVLTQQAIPAEDITPETIGDAERAVEELTGTEPEVLEARLRAQRRLRVLRDLRPAVS